MENGKEGRRVGIGEEGNWDVGDWVDGWLWGSAIGEEEGRKQQYGCANEYCLYIASSLLELFPRIIVRLDFFSLSKGSRHSVPLRSKGRHVELRLHEDRRMRILNVVEADISNEGVAVPLTRILLALR